MTDEILDYLGSLFVSEDIRRRSGITFETFVDLYMCGLITERAVGEK